MYIKMHKLRGLFSISNLLSNFSSRKFWKVINGILEIYVRFDQSNYANFLNETHHCCTNIGDSY